MIYFAIAALGWVLIPILDAVYEGKTGDSLLPEGEENRVTTIMFWPIAVPLVVIGMAFGCLLEKYLSFLDKLRKRQ